MDYSSILSAIRALKVEDRIRLVEAIWNDSQLEERMHLVEVLWDESAPDAAYPALTEAQERELDRRLADDDANPEDVIPWEVIRADASARCQR